VTVSRRALLGALVLGILAAPLGAAAQPSGRVYRVGRLYPALSDPASTEAFTRGLRELGWAVDQTLLVETRSADGQADRLPALAAELVRLNVDVIVAGGDSAIEAARQATASVPIVMAVATDAVERGFVASLARPGGNVTGLSAFLPELAGKRIELLAEILPRLRRLGVISGPVHFHRSELARIEAAARALGIEVHPVEVTEPAELPRAVGALVKAGAKAVYVQPSAGLTDPNRARLAALARSRRLPAMGAIPYYVEAGFLLSYGPSHLAWHHRAAYFVDRILKGARPADLPVEQPTTFELVINLKTARALKLTVPPSLLQRADRVIE